MSSLNAAATYGLILARGGSKGVPRKNVRSVGGRPLIAYTVEAARAAARLDRVFVSTDDEEIARVARGLGAEVPFLRSPELAQDDTPDFPVIAHFADWADRQGLRPDLIAYLRPTTPFKTGAMIDEAVGLLVDRPACTAVRSVTRSEAVHHPFWMYRIVDGALEPFIEGIDVMRDYPRRQLLPPCYRLNGVVDVLRTGNLAGGTLYGEAIAPLVIPEEAALDIDTETDLALFEFLLRRRAETQEP